MGEVLTMRGDDEGLPPGDEQTDTYHADDFQRGGGKAGAGFIWFSCADAGRDRVLQLSNLREMEPGGPTETVAWLHFAGEAVKLEGHGLRRVIYRLFLGRSSRMYEIKPGQKPEKPDDPVIERITFLVPPPPEPANRKQG